MRALLLTLATVALFAGCLDYLPDEPDEADPVRGDAMRPPEGPPQVLAGHETFTQRVSAAVSPNRGEAAAFDAEIPPVLLDLEATLTWQNGTNRFTLEVRGPGGATETFPAPADVNQRRIEADVDDLGGGAYRFLVVVQGVQVPDTLTLNVSHRRLAPGTSGTAGDDVPVRLERSGSHWLATIAYAASAPVGDTLTADIKGVNGALTLGASAGREATLTMVAWARGTTPEAAAERARAIPIDLRLDESGAVGRPHGSSWSDRGVHAGLHVPRATEVTGSLASSNGPAEAQDVRVRDLRLATSNGPVSLHAVDAVDLAVETSNGPLEGDARFAGSLALETSNGPIDAQLRPQDDASLTVATSNGPVKLTLEERGDVAYELDASTSNGRITERMDDASLDGTDRDATLRTRDGGGRDVQVTGSVETSNGDVRFHGS